MSFFLLDFDKEINFDFNNLIIDDRIKISDDSFKYLIFFDKNNPKELYLKLPKIRLTYDWTNIKYTNIKLRLTPKYLKIDSFVNFIDELEEFFINNKNIRKKNLDFVSIIEKEKNTFFLKTFFNENKIVITNDLSKKIKYTDFKINAEINVILKISGIWQKNGKYGLSTQIHQIKYFYPPEELLIDMIDFSNNPSENKNIKKENKNESDLEVIKPLNIFPKQLIGIDPKMLQSIKLKPIEPKN